MEVEPKVIITAICVTPGKLYDEGAVSIELIDEGAGTFLEIDDGQGGHIRLGHDEIQRIALAAKILGKEWV